MYITILLQNVVILIFLDQTIPNILLPPTGFNQNTVGQRLDVICSISVPPDMDPDTIELGWVNEEGIITTNNRVIITESVKGSTNNSSNVSTSVITTVIRFDPLFEDDEGNYSCYSIGNKSVKFTPVQLQNFKSK